LNGNEAEKEGKSGGEAGAKKCQEKDGGHVRRGREYQSMIVRQQVSRLAMGFVKRLCG
jgi:hypothetical protein